jgi:hypothetical protein
MLLKLKLKLKHKLKHYKLYQEYMIIDMRTILLS